MSQYEKLSILPEGKLSFSPNVSIAILVITRWNDLESRMFLRNTILGSTEKALLKKIKLLFVFGIPQNMSKNESDQMKNEQDEFQDMIIPSEYSILIFAIFIAPLKVLRDKMLERC